MPQADGRPNLAPAFRIVEVSRHEPGVFSVHGLEGADGDQLSGHPLTELDCALQSAFAGPERSRPQTIVRPSSCASSPPGPDVAAAESQADGATPSLTDITLTSARYRSPRASAYCMVRREYSD